MLWSGLWGSCVGRGWGSKDLLLQPGIDKVLMKELKIEKEPCAGMNKTP
jgi:hypothetical protein